MSANQELAVTKYCYNAGNVNLYQTQQISQFYGVKRLSAGWTQPPQFRF